MKKVSVIIVNWNSTDLTKKCICSLLEQSYQPFEIIIVDNNSTEDRLDSLAQLSQKVILIRSNKNLGYTGANNLGVKQSEGEYLLILNNDTELEKNCIANLVSELDSNKNIAAVSPIIRYFDQKEKIQYCGSSDIKLLNGRHSWKTKNPPTGSSYTEAIHGAAFMIKKDSIKNPDLFDNSFFAYYEELDLSLRLKKSGFHLAVQAKAICYHKVSKTVKRNSPIRCRLMTRNRIILSKKHLKGIKKWLFIIYILTLSLPKNFLTNFIKNKKNIEAYLTGFKQGLFSRI